MILGDSKAWYILVYIMVYSDGIFEDNLKKFTKNNFNPDDNVMKPL